MNSRIGTPFHLFFLNPDYVAARSLRSLRSNNFLMLQATQPGPQSLAILSKVVLFFLNFINYYTSTVTLNKSSK